MCEVPGMSYSGFKLYTSLLFPAKAARLNVRCFRASAEELQIKRKALKHELVRITSLSGAAKETCWGSADVDGANVCEALGFSGSVPAFSHRLLWGIS